MADEKKTLTLISSDKEQFIVPESSAILSVTIKNMVEHCCSDNVIPVLNVDSKTLAKVTTYLNKHAQEGATDEEKNMFDEEFVDVEMSVLFNLILAANYLEIKGLLEMLAQKIADKIKNKSVKWVRKVFKIENDFTLEEEEEIKKEYAWAWEGVDPDDDDRVSYL